MKNIFSYVFRRFIFEAIYGRDQVGIILIITMELVIAVLDPRIKFLDHSSDIHQVQHLLWSTLVYLKNCKGQGFLGN